MFLFSLVPESPGHTSHGRPAASAPVGVELRETCWSVERPVRESLRETREP
jgi:hypothetical protein